MAPADVVRPPARLTSRQGRRVDVIGLPDAVLQVDFYYDTGDKGPERPVVRNIWISGLNARKAKYALSLRGFPGDRIRVAENLGVPILIDAILVIGHKGKLIGRTLRPVFETSEDPVCRKNVGDWRTGNFGKKGGRCFE